MKIATWNINGVRGRLPLLLKWLAKTKPDGVALLALKADPVLIRKALPGDPDDKASRHIEAAVDGVLFACLYIPNGNPQPRSAVCLQARLVRSADRACAHVEEISRACRAALRLQRRAD